MTVNCVSADNLFFDAESDLVLHSTDNTL